MSKKMYGYGFIIHRLLLAECLCTSVTFSSVLLRLTYNYFYTANSRMNKGKTDSDVFTYAKKKINWRTELCTIARMVGSVTWKI